MAMQNFVVDLLERLLADKSLGLKEDDVRYYDQGTTATEQVVDGQIRWLNAKYFNSDTDVVRSGMLMVRLGVSETVTQYMTWQMGEMYRIYRKNGIEAVMPIVGGQIKAAKNEANRTLQMASQFADFEAVKDKLILRPLNYENREASLKNGVYQRYGDIALTLYISLGGSGKQILSTMVPATLLDAWGKDKEELFALALGNTERMQPARFRKLLNFGPNPNEMVDIPLLDGDNDNIVKELAGSPSPILDTTQGTNGAIVMWYPDVQRKLYEAIGEDYYVVFTSTHDVHVHPVSSKFSYTRMLDGLRRTNQGYNDREDVLTNMIFRYVGENDKLVIAG